MNKIFAIIGMAAVGAMAADLPICEEFNGESNVECVAGETSAVIISHFTDGSVAYEFFTAKGKGYVQIDGGIFARSAKRALDVANIPAEDKERYIAEVFDAVMDDIAWVGQD